jgi:hypothetical protein
MRGQVRRGSHDKNPSWDVVVVTPCRATYVSHPKPRAGSCCRSSQKAASSTGKLGARVESRLISHGILPRVSAFNSHDLFEFLQRLRIYISIEQGPAEGPWALDKFSLENMDAVAAAKAVNQKEEEKPSAWGFHFQSFFHCHLRAYSIMGHSRLDVFLTWSPRRSRIVATVKIRLGVREERLVPWGARVNGFHSEIIQVAIKKTLSIFLVCSVASPGALD